MKKLKSRDLKFVALCAATMALTGMFIQESRETADMISGGYRKIDLRAVKRLIQKGELVDREAMYYRAVVGP